MLENPCNEANTFPDEIFTSVIQHNYKRLKETLNEYQICFKLTYR